MLEWFSMALDLNPHFKQAWETMDKTDRHLFITGKAGTGKSTLLDYFRTKTQKKVVVLAPTGVAAVNVRGQTIHSFFGFKPDITPEAVARIPVRNRELLKELDAIVIDEISMVRADLLDCVDKYLRLHGHDKYLPFGGIQMIFFGDLYQLPPVVTERDRELLARQYASPYFFDANVFACLTLDIMELETIYRQRDESFITILNAIRGNTANASHFQRLNERYTADREAASTLAITLTTTNALADAVNTEALASLATEAVTYNGVVSGTFMEKDAPVPFALVLKKGAQVMLLNNDTGKRWVNGTIGTITSIKKAADKDEADTLMVKIDDGRTVPVLPYTWDAHEFVLDHDTKAISSRPVGSLTQYPLKLAWAVTIHKSQGKTFEQVVIDLGRGTFAHGQLYVALSRCTSLGGITLKQLVQPRHVLMDRRVMAFMAQFNDQKVYRGAEAVDLPQHLF